MNAGRTPPRDRENEDREGTAVHRLEMYDTIAVDLRHAIVAFIIVTLRTFGTVSGRSKR